MTSHPTTQRTSEEKSNPFGVWSLAGSLAVVFAMTVSVSAFAQAPAAPAPVGFDQLVKRMASELKECEPPIDEVETIAAATNVKRGRPAQHNYLAIRGVNHIESGDLGPLTQPATPAQLKSLVGKKFCMISN